jgi:hypothetical protein
MIRLAREASILWCYHTDTQRFNEPVANVGSVSVSLRSTICQAPNNRLQRTVMDKVPRHNVRQQSRLFARWNQSLRHSPNSNRRC